MAPIHGKIKKWVEDNIDRWEAERPKWFVIELIPDGFLPADTLTAEG